MTTQSAPGRVHRPGLLSTLWIFLLLNLIFRDIRLDLENPIGAPSDLGA